VRVAAIDIGTNTVLLLVAETGPDGELRAVAERATITRLGEGVDRTRRFAPAAVERTLACLDDYAGVIRASGTARMAVVGTSALRDAQGSGEVREAIRDRLGVELRVIGGEDEARLTFSGALDGLKRTDPGAVVFDIGGGSTEIVMGNQDGPSASLSYVLSLDVGSVRLTERHGTDRGALEAAARAALADVPPLPAAGITPVGVAGTMTTLASVALALPQYDGARVHGHVMSTMELRDVVNRLAALPIEARRAVPGMEPKRADVIVAGGVIALALLDRWSCASTCISDRGVRWGLARELALSPSIAPMDLTRGTSTH
jgi:exopolyphosphatase/guanosine-5'-triphosphate,3'-diphosphate pyrophosphatase